MLVGQPGPLCCCGGYLQEIHVFHADCRSSVPEISQSCLTELSNTEADSAKEHTLEETTGAGTEEMLSKRKTETPSKNHELLVLQVILSP